MPTAVLSTTLLGCAPNNSFVSLQGAGDAFPRAQYQILGKTKYDQIWISKTIEAEVSGFGFARPIARPATLDARPAAHTVVVTPAKVAPLPLITPSEPAVVTVVPKKKHWWQHFRK